MTLTCPNCQTRLQLDDEKTPAQPFTVRCPKCQAAVKLQPAGDRDQMSSGAPPDATAPFQFGRQLAPRFNPEPDSAVSASHGQNVSADLNSLAKLLADALRNANGSATGIQKPRKGARQVLICLPQPSDERAARLLAEENYEVFVANNLAQALGTMREDRIDVLVLDSGFDPVEQGTAFVIREIKVLRPALRRRLFLVYVSPSLRTMDSHAAFLQNANLVLNPGDLDKLPELLDATLRNYNELYRDYFEALNVQPI